MKPYTQVISTTLAVVVLSISVVHSAVASTTISTDITTGGALNVTGASTLATTTMTNLTVTYTLATSTFANGINLTGGCFEVGGACVSSGGAATTPAGASSTVQYNKNGVFGGNSGLVYDGSTLTAANLTVTGVTTISGSLNANVIPLQGTFASLSSVVPASGQFVYATDSKNSYVGDGTSAISSIVPVSVWTKAGTNISYNTGNVLTNKTLYATTTVSGTLNTNTINLSNVINVPNITTEGNFYVGANGCIGEPDAGGFIFESASACDPTLDDGVIDTGGLIVSGANGTPSTIILGVPIVVGNSGSGQTGTSTFAGNIRLQKPMTPISSSMACTKGDMTWDTGFIYICTATNTWKRATLSTF